MEIKYKLLIYFYKNKSLINVWTFKKINNIKKMSLLLIARNKDSAMEE